MISANPITGPASQDLLISYVNLKLSLLGFPPATANARGELSDVTSSFIAQYREKERLLATHLCSADQRIQTFLYDYLQDIPGRAAPVAHAHAGSSGYGTRAVPAGRS